MRRIFLIGLILLLFTSNLISQQLAFPGAEGFGKFAKGGRGGDVYHVTNLYDDGPGSLRQGIEDMSGPRTIVFDISGTIMLEDRIIVNKPYLTVAGQTAPGDGITLVGGEFYVEASNVIVRYIRVRLGDQSGGDYDAISIKGGKNIIFDHVTASWSIDETFSCRKVDSVTVQWCLISESLRYSHHKSGAHGYGGIIGGLRTTFHHNLYAHHSSRSPKVTWREHAEVDFRNNVIYNWGYKNCYDGTSGYINWANNYYKAGPGTLGKPITSSDKVTSNNIRYVIFLLSDADKGEFEDYETSLYAEGNFVNGYPSITANNWSGGIVFTAGASEIKNRKYTPHDFPAINEQTAEEAASLVVQEAGASLVRDVVDKRIANEVINGTATYNGSKSGTPGIIDSQNDVGGWPALKEKTRDVDFDTDGDGIPDKWEKRNGLNPNNAHDRNNVGEDGYTMLERYLNNIK